MKRLRPQNVRARLTTWYVAILAAVLLIYGGSTSALLLLQLRSQLDHLAIVDLETVEGLLSLGSNGKVFLRNDYHDHPYPNKDAGEANGSVVRGWSSLVPQRAAR